MWLATRCISARQSRTRGDRIARDQRPNTSRLVVHSVRAPQLHHSTHTRAHPITRTALLHAHPPARHVHLGSPRHGRGPNHAPVAQNRQNETPSIHPPVVCMCLSRASTAPSLFLLVVALSLAMHRRSSVSTRTHCDEVRAACCEAVSGRRRLMQRRERRRNLLLQVVCVLVHAQHLALEVNLVLHAPQHVQPIPCSNSQYRLGCPVRAPAPSPVSRPRGQTARVARPACG